MKQRVNYKIQFEIKRFLRFLYFLNLSFKEESILKYYKYLPREVDGVFGLDLLNSLDRNIYITEGIFKAAKLHNLGYNSIAVLTSSPKRLRPWLYIMKQTWNLIAIGDNDKAGKGLIDMIGKGFQSPIDIDEMINYDVIKMIEENK